MYVWEQFFHVQAEFCSALSEKLHWNHQLCLSQLLAFFCAGVLHKHHCLCCFQRLENASVVQVAEEGTSKEQTAGLGYIQGEQKSGNTLYSIQMLKLKTMFFHIRTLGPLQDCKRSHVDNIVFPLSRHNWDNNYSNRCFCKSSITDTLEKWWLKLTEATQRWSCASPWQALLSGLCQAFCWKEKDINYKIFSWMLFNSTTSPFVIPSRQFPSPMDQQKMQVFKEFYESSVLILTSHGLIYEEWEQDKKYKRRLLNNKSEVMPKLLGVLTCAFPILSLCKEKQNTLVNSFTLWSQYDPPMSFAECAGYVSSWSSSNVLMLCSYPVLTVNISSWLCSRETVLKLWSAKSFVKKKRLFFFLQYMHL